MRELTIEELKQEIEDELSPTFFGIKIEEVESRLENAKAWNVKISPITDTALIFELHIEPIDECFQFEAYDDCWEHLDKLHAYLFSEAIDIIQQMRKEMKNK